MRKSKKFQTRVRRFETLETRTLLAGNVTAAVTAGELDIIGDAAGNAIQVSQTTSGDWKVQGIATTVNGHNAQTFPGVTAGILINLGNGNDFVKVFNGTTPVGLDIQMGAGNDVVQGSNLTVSDIFQIEVGDGNNTVSLNKIISNGPFGLGTGNGNDVIAITNSHLNEEVEMGTGNGTHVLSMNTVSTGGPVDIEMGDGADAVALVNITADRGFGIDLGGGTNSLSANHVTVASNFDFDITGGDGKDAVALANVTLHGGELNINTNEGNDAVSIFQTTVNGDLKIDTGGGTDAVILNTVNDTEFDSIDVSLGPGNYDALVVVNCTALVVNFDGGGNTGDTLVKAHNHFDVESDTGFQYVIG